jgi:hypothetical protein
MVRIASWVRCHELVIVPAMGVLEDPAAAAVAVSPRDVGSARPTDVGDQGGAGQHGANVSSERLTRLLFTAATRFAFYRSYGDEPSRKAIRRPRPTEHDPLRILREDEVLPAGAPARSRLGMRRHGTRIDLRGPAAGHGTSQHGRRHAMPQRDVRSCEPSSLRRQYDGLYLHTRRKGSAKVHLEIICSRRVGWVSQATMTDFAQLNASA